jgi:hypothetical protein
MSTDDDDLDAEAISTSPWTPEEVLNLEAWQACTWVHPYTCGPCRDADPTDRDRLSMWRSDHPLVPTVNGWRCPTCNYRQNWCYGPMVYGPPPNPFERR